MTPEDRIRRGNVVLVFDAPNMPTRRLFKLAKDAFDKGLNIQCLVPITAHTEKLTHIRRTRVNDYDANAVKNALKDAYVTIVPLDEINGNQIVERLCSLYPESNDWQDAKWERLYGTKPRSKGQKAPATIDWYTAALCPPDAIIVSDDHGVEFAKFKDIGIHRLGSQELEAILTSLTPAP